MLTIKMLNGDGSYSVAAEDEGVGFRVETSKFIFDIRESSDGGLQVFSRDWPILIRPEQMNTVTILGPEKKK